LATSSGQTISHAYTATGVYTVTLVVTDACGYADTVQVLSAATVVSACAPVSGAAITFSPAAPVTGATVTFTGTVAVTSTSPIAYAWNFGTPSTGRKIAQGTSSVVTHSYDVSGAYTVVMTATNGCGEDTASETITVESPPCTGLSDVFINGPDSGYTGVPYTITAAIAPADATTPTVYTWSPTPDSAQGMASASYQWATPGVYTITLTAENCMPPYAVAVSDTHAITIETPPGAVIDPTTGGTIIYTDTQRLTTIVQDPAGAVTEIITLLYTPIDAPTRAISPELRFAGHAFNLEAYLGGELQIGFVFSNPITITIHYSDDDVQGLDEESLTLEYWNGSAWEDAACGLYNRHPDENWLSVPVCHLSEFALLGEGEEHIYLPLIVRQSTSTYQDLQSRVKYARMGKKAGSKR
jgi:PKD repeat protein